jgi:hypothetical protein
MSLAWSCVTIMLDELDDEREYPLSLLSMTVGSRGPAPEWYVKLIVDLLRVATEEWARGLGWTPEVGYVDIRQRFLKRQEAIQRLEDEMFERQILWEQG